MNKLTKESLILLAMELEYPEIIKFCQTSKKINNDVCKNNNFWLRKLYFKYPFSKNLYFDTSNMKNMYENIEKEINKKFEENSENIIIEEFDKPSFIKSEFADFLLNTNFDITYNNIPINFIFYNILKRKIFSYSLANILVNIYLAKYKFVENDGKTYYKVGPEMNKYLDSYLTELENKNIDEKRSFNRNKFQFNKISSIIYSLFIKKSLTVFENRELSDSIQILKYLKNIIKKKITRKCNNSKDPISFTLIENLDDEHYIRLESGECWEFESLLDYIQNYTQGVNDASKLKNYSSKVIWKNNEELNKILNNPIAIKSGFVNWFNSKNIQVGYISDKTLKMLKRTASLLSSKGGEFQDALEKELNREQLEELKKAGNDINKIKNAEIAKEIEFTINNTLKSMAIENFFNYYNSLSNEEKNALKEIDNELENTLINCRTGHFCVFGFADILLSDYNKIIGFK